MKRTLITITKTIIFMAGLFSALYIFMPWREAGNFAMSTAHNILQRRGMRLNYSDVSGEDGGFTVHNVKLSGMANISLSSVTIKPELTASILSLAPVCRITFTGGNVRLGQTMNFGDGRLLLTAGREILLEDMKTNGEFSLDGYMTIDTSTLRIGHADAKLTVPEEFSQNMNMMKNFLPIVEEGGTWYLRRK